MLNFNQHTPKNNLQFDTVYIHHNAMVFTETIYSFRTDWSELRLITTSMEYEKQERLK